MAIGNLERDELLDLIFQLDQAEYNHQVWYNSIIRSLICHIRPDRHDVRPESHKECRFGQWYYEIPSLKIDEHPGLVALGKEHHYVHQKARQLLKTVDNGGTVAPQDYDEFSNALERMRLEIKALQRELNELLYSRDALTGAINRVNMLQDLREQQAFVKRNLQKCTIAMLDLDHFKKVNDEYGHTAGDSVLAGIARYIMENIRPYDKFFRVGGEEFLICFQNAGMQESFDMVERVRRGVAKEKIYINDKTFVKITASFGLAIIEDDIPIEQSIENADKALYMAKDAGRNNSKIWRES